VTEVVQARPAWSEWGPGGPGLAWSVGIEEEVMLLDPVDWNLASEVDSVLAAAGNALSAHLSQETHGSAVELATDPHPTVPEAIAQLHDLRVSLRSTLRGCGLVGGTAGTHPFAEWRDIHVSGGPRQRQLHETMRELARREPTFALHVHVAIPDPEAATRAMNRMRAHLPLLLALSANSPFWQGRDSGLASARVPLFGAFPRSGIPREFASYDDLVQTTDLLIRCGAFPEPTFIWWDVRLQPRYGTLEVRIMDAQTRVSDTAALVALVQALVRVEAEEEGLAPSSLVHAPEVLEENRFLALRDGLEAQFLDPEKLTMVPAREALTRIVEAVAPVAADLGGGTALVAIEDLLHNPGPDRQRLAAAGPRGLISLVQDLTGHF
jgi:carboxylate-amine ligase